LVCEGYSKTDIEMMDGDEYDFLLLLLFELKKAAPQTGGL
jgi:hypothetical protein